MEVLAKEIIRKAKMQLKEAGVPDFDWDCRILAEHFLHIKRDTLLLYPDFCVDEEVAGTFLDAVEKRCQRVPVQHLTGVQEFMGMEFCVNSNVLIPRQDTEILVETVLNKMENTSEQRVLDLCTGSGCIAISIDRLASHAVVFASDISAEALKVAKKNNEKNHGNVTFVESDLFRNIEGKFDVIVSNPPYIRTDEIEELMEEVKVYDPRIALDGLEDGLWFYKQITAQAKDYLTSEGKIFFEIGFDQGEEVKGLLQENGFTEVEILKDLAGLDRVVYGGKINV